jgi:hypothetical protein
MERLVKLFPAEAISAFPLLMPLATQVGTWAVWVVAWTLLFVVIVLRWHATSAPQKGPQWPAVVVASISFVIWVYVMKGDFGFYELARHVWLGEGSSPTDAGKVESATQFISSLALVVWTIVVPVFYQGGD